MTRRGGRVQRCRPYRSAVAVAIALGAALAGACSSTTTTSAPPGNGGTGGTSGGGTVAGTAPGTTVPSPSAVKDWAVYGHDLANTRLNATESKLTAKTVANLKEGWTKGDMVGVTGTPTVADGVVYFGDWKGTLHAVAASSGDERWTATMGGFVVGSPAIDGDGVFASTGHVLYRFDKKTGAEVWKVDVNEHPLAQISASPVVVGDLVIQGVASAEVVMAKKEYTFKGSIGAYDTKTGKEAWRFYTTTADATAGAGVGVWSTPAVDVGRGLLYVGTGNAYSPPTGTYADSILAIEYKTGKLRWSTQFTNPDVFSAGNPGGPDADVGASPNLWSIDGRDVVGAGDKGGTFHTVDRDTGEVVWERELTPGSVFGGEIGSGAYVDGKLVVVSNVGDPATNAPKNTSHVFGVDPKNGDILWTSEELKGKIFGPVSAVPGVAFVGTDAATMRAFDVATGKTLWTKDAPAQIGGGASIADGRLIWGYGFTLFKGAGPGGITSYEVGP